MTRLRFLLLAAALSLPAAPAFAADSGASGETASSGGAASAALSPEQRSVYREVFAAIRAGDWAGASARLAAAPEGPLHDAARAELFLAKGSPKAELPDLLSILERAPEMPKAEQIARLALTRGATEVPALPEAQKLVWVGSQPRRSRAEATKGDPAAAQLEPLVQPLIKDNRPQEAEALFLQSQDQLGAEARTEYQQRIAWSYYTVGADGDARRLAALARAGSGEWAVHGAWSEGLAAWRQGDCKAAADAFGNVSGRSTDVEMASAAHYWTARAEMMCGRPERVQ
ncbi:MAG TPA: lytic transglycosylase domain-containing protein, partial [Allosphingosinicella sp.]|nr:lytic transglycosylase domain-containing protein [Allosphingosinicella sp.]